MPLVPIRTDVELTEPHPEEMTPDDAVYVVVDRPPGPEPSRFLDIEDGEGRSVNVGEWVERPNGTWALRITAAG